MFVMSSSSIPNGIFIIDGQERYVNPEGDVESNKSERTSKASMVFQMCEKQCRDENGFKCHCMSESHQRQMQVLGQNPTRVVNGYSQEFEQTFLDLMRRSHRFSRVAATVVYNEYINDRLHVHMNSTKWATLTEFIKYLGKTAEEEKQEREIQKQIERASAGCEGKDVVVDDDDNDDDEKKKDEDFRLKKVGFALGLGVKERGESSKLVFGDEENDKVERGDKRKRSALDELMKEEEKKKERMNRKDYWLFEGIIVKGVVKRVIDKYVGEIEMLESKHVLRVDQVELKTVLPQIGGMVKIVNGAYRGSNTRLLDLDTEKFCAKVQIEKGVYDGRVIKSIEYEDICKLA
ncbi:DNA/RNA-binding protein Kin17, conserved region [Arabidopsis thaliana]|uniref:KIN17-like protein KLP n=1 Tax=Arabidopsis thaliana TaxID=3702 RepID=KLP_ARATH|nr:DNA/RNA-binding protein Kin17, conserved region [Arabidopsis thaliana]F4KDD7.1 RecName: Full=KIN17-like protein KLP [Arabidopsis thaliana]AED96127.1 DNA/RNA-binding protein Kin17, conserved region [Arabidopsis thaliana]|eukprot:NP_680423.1 DNA/RNA-binding protein Kin17, conserved region [Arabidopsis thaliana]